MCTLERGFSCIPMHASLLRPDADILIHLPPPPRERPSSPAVINYKVENLICPGVRYFLREAPRERARGREVRDR